MENSIQELQDKIDDLYLKHEEDLDLSHELGSDSYCLYCEQYVKLTKQQTLLKKEWKKKHSNSKGTHLKKVKEKKLFEVSLTDASKYLVYALDEAEIAKLLKINMSAIHQQTVIAAKYWDTFYIETNNGTLTTVKQLIKTKRSRVVSTYSISTNQDVRHYCFNDIPFEYLIYNDKRFELLERFAKPYLVTKTKKFNANGRASIQLPTGSIGVSKGDVLLKITNKVIVAIDKEDFQQHFSQEENYTWTADYN